MVIKPKKIEIVPPNYKEAATTWGFVSTYGDDGYFTVVATCTQEKVDLDGEKFSDSRSVKVIDRDVARANVSAYNSLLEVLKALDFNLLKEG